MVSAHPPERAARGERGMRDLVNPIRDLFDAAVRQPSIKLTCRRCGHTATLSAHALWYLFRKKGWQDELRAVQKRCVCTVCFMQGRRKVYGPDLELVDAEPTESRFPMPSEFEWKAELRRRR